MSIVRWEDPPPHGNTNRSKSGFLAIAEELRSFPGAWAVIAEGLNPGTAGSVASRIRAGQGGVGAEGCLRIPLCRPDRRISQGVRALRRGAIMIYTPSILLAFARVYWRRLREWLHREPPMDRLLSLPPIGLDDTVAFELPDALPRAALGFDPVLRRLLDGFDDPVKAAGDAAWWRIWYAQQADTRGPKHAANDTKPRVRPGWVVTDVTREFDQIVARMEVAGVR